MDFAWFTDLGHLARTGNFSRAAELSHISQPAFSRRIRAIEGWAGTTLVDRSRQPVRLTAAGTQLLEAGEQALARLESEREQILAAQSTEDRHTVTFGAQHAIAWRFFPDWMQAFERSYGPVIARLRADDLKGCIADLEAGELDFLAAYASAAAPGVEGLGQLQSLRIGADTLIPVSGRRADGAPFFDPEISRMPLPLLWYGDGAPISHHAMPLLRRALAANRLTIAYENAMSGALRIRARDGAGIAWLPRSLTRPDIEAGSLMRVGPPDWDIPLEIRLYRLGSQTNRHSRAIWSYLSVREHAPLLDRA